jgi:DNA helicase II / ATP-dependent DNA helicase PcrA
MKKKEIEVGGTYTAKVSGRLTTVRVTDIRTRQGYGANRRDTTVFDVTNLATGRKTTFASAAKFRSVANAQAPLPPRRYPPRDLHCRCSTDAVADAVPSEAVVVELSIDDVEPICDVRHQTLADRIRVSKDTGVDKAPHVIVEARAGTGKTTTLVEGLKLVKGIETQLIPSPQQAAVWDQMRLSYGRAQSVCFCCFNRSIRDELAKRVPAGCDALTMHSMGLRAISKAFPEPRINVDGRYTEEIVSQLLNREIWEVRRRQPEMLSAVCKLVDLCKMNLVGCDVPGATVAETVGRHGMTEALQDLADYYEIDINGQASQVFDLVPRVLESSKDVQRHGTITYADMIWLPIALDLNVYRYDLLLVDEAQDLNRCQQALAKKASRRLILCGDPRQAIYGFAGADARSMSRLEEELSVTERGCVHLPLTVTRRCGKAIVAEAQTIVPDFEAFESNSPGIVTSAGFKAGERVDYHLIVSENDMVLCRCNAPLVSECFRFIRAGRKANIQGRDVGVGLVKTVRKLMKGYTPRIPDPMGAADNYENRHGTGQDTEDLCPGATQLPTDEILELYRRLDAWYCGEVKKENAKHHPSEQRLVNLGDRRDCITCFTEGVRTTDEVVKKIEGIFTDDEEALGIRLSSVHKAKGLEAKRVFILVPKESPMPHPMAKSTWEREQEMNLKYVAITRAIEELVWVS